MADNYLLAITIHLLFAIGYQLFAISVPYAPCACGSAGNTC
jgi:hypothetical protein